MLAIKPNEKIKLDIGGGGGGGEGGGDNVITSYYFARCLFLNFNHVIIKKELILLFLHIMVSQNIKIKC
jgi:hypothetical protein